jgi:hypothetical protein
MLDYPLKDHRIVGQPDPLIVGSSAHVIGSGAQVLAKTLHPAQTSRARRTGPAIIVPH